MLIFAIVLNCFIALIYLASYLFRCVSHTNCHSVGMHLNVTIFIPVIQETCHIDPQKVVNQNC